MTKLTKVQKLVLKRIESKEKRKEMKKMFKAVNAEKNISDSTKTLNKLFKKGINPTPFVKTNNEKRFTLAQMEHCFEQSRLNQPGIGLLNNPTIAFKYHDFNEYLRSIEHEK